MDGRLANATIEDLRTPPYKATVEFEELHYLPGDHKLDKTERYLAHFVFIVRDQVPNALIPVNPLGLTITKTRHSSKAHRCCGDEYRKGGKIIALGAAIMDPSWPHTFRARMHSFEMRHSPQPGAVSVSIKVRVTSGCFHRSCSPRAYELIDEHLCRMSSSETDYGFEEHESGPEILLYVTAGVGLATSIINLVATIIKARSEGVKRGDRPSAPVELVVRRMVGCESIQDEVVMKYDQADPVSARMVEQSLNDALGRLAGEENMKPKSGTRASTNKPKKRT